jgi:diguanylate cyclase (GGDEF)-like protein/PAS domain S-box-containing protein
VFSFLPEDDHDQALRIKRFLMACSAYLIWCFIVTVIFLLGLTLVPLYVVVGSLSGILVYNISLYAIFRTGFNKRFKDPSLTFLQMLIATFWTMVVLYYAESTRSAALIIYLVVFVFGLFKLNVRQLLFLSAFAVVNYATIIFFLYKIHPESVNIKTDLLNIVVLAVVLPWFSVVGGYITRLKAKISNSLSTIRQMTDNIHDVIFVLDMNLHYTYVSPSVKTLRGYEPEEVLKQQAPFDAFTPSSEKLAKKTLSEIMELEKSGHDVPISRTLQLEVRRKDASTVWTETKVSFIRDKTQQPVGILGVMRDITERKRIEQQLSYMATHDTLTGLPNRLMFNQILNQAIRSAQRHKRQMAVFFVDLDRFKTINDTLGHEAGDRLLKEIARRFRRSLRSVDVVSRLGGDEFVMLVEEVNDLREAATVAHKLLSSAIKPMVLLGQECRVTASIGISIYPQDGLDEQSLMKNADIAMYFAKEAGKNNYQFYSRDIAQSNERLGIESNLRLTLDRKELSLLYQAKVDFKTGMITGVEALLRWQSKTLGSITPAQFIPVAEVTGMIVPIGKWVLKTACAQNVAWQRQGLPPVRISVNLSLRQLMDDQLLNDLKTILNDSGMAPNLLELEITESMLMHDPPRLIAVLDNIKKLGVRLTIDDFGTGYSSLTHLKNFPLDTLKVDRSFIRNLPLDSGKKAVTGAIIALGKTLSPTVVAEGVETQAQEDFLRDHICDEMQGFYFSKPIMPDQFGDLLRQHNPSAEKLNSSDHHRFTDFITGNGA